MARSRASQSRLTILTAAYCCLLLCLLLTSTVAYHDGCRLGQAIAGSFNPDGSRGAAIAGCSKEEAELQAPADLQTLQTCRPCALPCTHSLRPPSAPPLCTSLYPLRDPTVP